MALNWAMIASDGQNPVPLPREKIIFISRPTLSHFKSLSIPLLNLKEGKLQQPWFGANYYQAIVIPVLNGGLSSPGQMKITFKEGGGFEFSTYYNEMISRLSETEGTIPEHAEPLPTYTPRENAEHSSSPLTAAVSTAAASTAAKSISTPEISNINNNELLPSTTTSSSIVTSPQLL
ncbi:882_t:CDS:2 [Diversispora eburnea]|uniref:882_t:CDS:1 n=1 Tax=Diversispora eburnea TaxID=1213867 RepID=A0A9N9C5A6_9GLOM|nr:882_t:CDS:2 [Diversispora eburnea]